jgi:hypothetical protein
MGLMNADDDSPSPQSHCSRGSPAQRTRRRRRAWHCGSEWPIPESQHALVFVRPRAVSWKDTASPKENAQCVSKADFTRPICPCQNLNPLSTGPLLEYDRKGVFDSPTAVVGDCGQHSSTITFNGHCQTFSAILHTQILKPDDEFLLSIPVLVWGRRCRSQDRLTTSARAAGSVNCSIPWPGDPSRIRDCPTRCK